MKKRSNRGVVNFFEWSIRLAILGGGSEKNGEKGEIEGSLTHSPQGHCEGSEWKQR